MADNVAITAGSGTSIASDDVSSVHYQKIKIALGADGAIDTLVDSGQQTSANSVPVVLPSDASDVKITLDSEVVVSQLADGSSSSLKATVLDYSNSNPLAVRLTDTGGDYVAAGAGTQYTEGDTDASITGTAMLLEGAANTLVAAPGTAADGLLVNLGSNNDVTNAGTFAVQVSSALPAGTNNIGDVDVLSIAAGDNNIGNVDIASIAAGDNNIGNVDIASALPAGTNNIGDVDVLTVPSDPFGANADAASATGSISAKLRFIAATGIPITGTVTVGSHAVTNAGTFVVQVDGSALTALQLIDNIVHVDDAAFTLGTHSGVMMMGFAGTQSVDANDAAALACTTAGALHVSDAGGSLTVDNGGTFAVQVSSLPASTNTIEVVGDAAHGAAVAGNPLLAGLEGRSTAPTAVDDGDIVRALATLLGKQVVYPFALPASTWSYASPAAVTDTADDEAKAAVATTRHYITSVQIFNSHDSTGTEVVIKDGATVLWRGWAEQTGGCTASFNPPLRGTANTAVNVANITNSSSTYFNLQGFSATE